MAKAKIYFRFDKAGNDWQGPYGEGSSLGADGNTAKDHAERQAWRQAQKGLQEWYDVRHASFAGQGVEVKIWVDNIVCPQCQLWMIAGVLRNLAAFEFRPKLFVEVKNGSTGSDSGTLGRQLRLLSDFGLLGSGDLVTDGVSLSPLGLLVTRSSD